MAFEDLEDSYEYNPNESNLSANAVTNSRPQENGDGVAVDGPDDEVVIKQRRTFAKLDEQRLLSAKGIPYIRKEAHISIRFKGRGHEHGDLRRLLRFYQLWAHNLFPKANFRDFIELCKKAGSGRSMRMYRQAWMDEEKFGGERDGDEQEENENESIRDGDVIETAGAEISGADAGIPTDLEVNDHITSITDIIDDYDSDDLWVRPREEMERDFETSTNAGPVADVGNNNSNVDDIPEENDIWAEIARDASNSVHHSSKPPSIHYSDDDDEIMAIIRREQEDQSPVEIIQQEDESPIEIIQQEDQSPADVSQEDKNPGEVVQQEDESPVDVIQRSPAFRGSVTLSP